jgi:hypothetical protein
VLAEVDKPKGNAVKLLIGFVFLAGVFGYSFWVLKRKKQRSALPQ